jgi:hypothetical protein
MHFKSPQIAARVVFIIGLLLMFLGSTFLLGSLADTSRLSVLAAFVFVVIGGLFAVFAIKLNKRSVYLFFAAFFLLIGFFLFLMALKVLSFSLSQSWPFLSVFAGLALIPAGWHHYGIIKGRYVVPALAFVALGCFLLIFSFKMIPLSFKQFVLSWWPLIVALAGLILILLSLGTKNKIEGAKP